MVTLEDMNKPDVKKTIFIISCHHIVNMYTLYVNNGTQTKT